MTTKLRIYSDIHEEFNIDNNYGPYVIPPLTNEKEQILILAGDIQIGVEAVIRFINNHKDRFKKVLFVCGNHEFYNNDFYTVLIGIKKAFKEDENVHFMNNTKIEIDNTIFLGCTLWSDFNKLDPFCMERSRMSMSDYYCIRNDNSPYSGFGGINRWTPEDSYNEFQRSKKFLEEELKEAKDNNKQSIVITHMAPSQLSISEQHKGDILNGAYYSDLSDIILDYEPKIWIHGHMHDSFDYTIGKTRVICNPKGYVPSGLNPDFIEDLLIEI